MRRTDRAIFVSAAQDLGLWILVRRTNPQSLEYVGRPGYVPKPIDCKPKTADRDLGPRKLAGLVVDPNSVPPDAFLPQKRPKALEAWTEFVQSGRLNNRGSTGLYSLESNPKSPHLGCLMLNERYIHGDYDLYDIIDPSGAHRNLAAVETLHGSPHMRGPRFFEVQRYVNSRIGVPMIQHGGEAQFKDHSEQSIDAFGPAGEDLTILNEHSLRVWYQDRFGGRPPITLS